MPAAAGERMGLASANAGARVLLVLAFLAFVALGLPDGLLGVAWPSMRASFDRPLSGLGTLLIALTAGYLLSSATGAAVAARWGAGRLLGAASTAATGAALAWAAAPWWGVALAASALLGVAWGLLDTGLNAYVAVRHGARALNLLHGCFGIGATVGPVLLTSLLGAGASWRAGYLALAAVEAVLALAFWRTRGRWALTPAGAEPPEGAAEDRRGGRVLLAVGVALFFVYTGLEVALGQWSFSLLTESRGVGPTAAGLLVSSYWAGLTAGRLLLGTVGPRRGGRAVLDVSMAGALSGTALLWLDPAGLGALGLPLTGFALAAVFPALVALTPERLGPTRAHAAVGFQLAAAGLGAGLLPAAAGWVMGRTSLERLGPLAVAAAAVMTVLHVAAAGLATRAARADPRTAGE